MWHIPPYVLHDDSLRFSARASQQITLAAAMWLGVTASHGDSVTPHKINCRVWAQCSNVQRRPHALGTVSAVPSCLLCLCTFCGSVKSNSGSK